jgi:hypothetical protein
VLRVAAPPPPAWDALLPAQARRLYLKHRYQLGYESLCREVADSISWRRFCHIGLDQLVPHSTTGQAGRPRRPQAIEQLNHLLLAKLAADKLLRARKLRIDTTVVEADIDSATGPDPPAAGRQPADPRPAGLAMRPGRPPDPQGQAHQTDRARLHRAAGRVRARVHRHPPHPPGQPARRRPTRPRHHRGHGHHRPATRCRGR